MSRISRLVVLVTALASLFAAMASTAGAVTWTNHGSTSFTATGGGGVLTSHSGVNINCSGSDASGDAPLSGTSATYTVSGTILFTNCLAAGSPATIECGYSLTATTFTAPVSTGNVDVTCGLYISGAKLCHIEGQTHGTYTNETATLTVTTTTGLAITGANCPAASPSSHLTQLDFKVSSATPPTITRVA